MRGLHRAEQRTSPRCRQSDAFALKTPITSLSSARPDLMAMLVEITALHQPGAMDGIGKAKRDNGRKHDQAQPIFVPHDVLHPGGRNAGAANAGRTFHAEGALRAPSLSALARVRRAVPRIPRG